MHVCAECGKKMATAAGLEIHEQLSHVAPPPPRQPDPEILEMASAARVADVPPVVRPRDRSAWPKIPALAFAIVIVLLTGVASAVLRNGGARNALALVQSAGAATSDTKTARMTLTMKGGSGALANGVTVEGGWDFANHRGLMQLDGAQFGQPAMGKLDVVFDYSSGFVMYMKFPPELARRLGNKPWVKMDVASFARENGSTVDFNSLMSDQSGDPTSGLALLHDADKVDKVGTEQIRGVDATHYRLQVSLEKALADAPADEQASLAQVQKAMGSGPMNLDVWIDGDNHVRRMQMALDGGTYAAKEAGTTLTIAYDFYDFGAPIDTAIPPADQVTNFNDLLKRGR